jgi:3-oxoacyl-[acyl-carrier protein] reductase
MMEADWDKVLSTNLKSVFLSVKECAKFMVRQNYGKIVVTSSVTGPRTGFPGMSHYGASKAGLIGFIRSAALEFAKNNITVNGVEPGTVLKEQVKRQMGIDAISQSEKFIPLRRLAFPEDIGNAVLFLASDESSYITGQTIVVDGGRTLVDIEQVLGATY